MNPYSAVPLGALDDSELLVLIASLTLFGFLVAKEVVLGLRTGHGRQANRILMIPIVPLLIVFVLAAAWRFAGVLRLPF
jgi:hypothetical protein